MTPIWHQVFSADDKMWQVLTSNGILYRSCKTSQQAYQAVCEACDAEAWDEFVGWQRDAGRRCMKFALIKMKQKRLQDHGPPVPPFEEF